MTVEIRRLLQLPGLNEEHWLAGAAEAGVGSVLGISGSTGEVSRRLSAMPKGASVMLVLLTPVPWFDVQFDILLRRSADAGITVLVLDAPSTALDAGTAALAVRLGVSLVGTPDPWATSVRMHELLAADQGPPARAALAAARIGLEAGPGLDETFALLEESIGYPLSFLDAGGRSLRTNGPLPPEVQHGLAALAGRSTPARVPLDEGEMIAVPVGTGVGPRAWLGVTLPAVVPSERAMATAALQVAAIVVGHRLVLTRLDDERDSHYRISMLDQIRSLAAAPPPSLVQRTIAAGWRLDEWHIGVRISARETGDYVALRREVETAFADEGLNVEVVEQVDGWAVWMSRPTEPSPTTVSEIAGRVRRAHIALGTAIPTDVGVGSAQSGALGLARTLGEATDAARIAVNRPGSGHFVHVDRLGLAQLLLAWTQTDTFLPAARQILAPLGHTTGDLHSTLRTYLDAESSLTETAAVLGVHRNTVADRITRIERILGVELQDPETRLALHLATRADRN